MHSQKRGNETVTCPVIIWRREAVEFKIGGGDSSNSQAFGEEVKQVNPGACVPKPFGQE